MIAEYPVIGGVQHSTAGGAESVGTQDADFHG